ncbi:MAG: sigma-70 family RNA polymerase sigma factor [Planctomycetales bacterium]
MEFDARSSPSTHPSLLLRIRDAGDAEAWNLFVKSYVPAIHGYCARHRLQDSDTRDVVQEVLTNVASAIHSFAYDPARGKFRSWLGVITRNTMLKFLDRTRLPGRGRGGDKPVAVELFDREVDPAWLDELNQHIFRTARGRVRNEFGNTEWAVFELNWEQRLPAPEAADRLGRDVGWIYKTKFRILQRLKAEMLVLASDYSVFRD